MQKHSLRKTGLHLAVMAALSTPVLAQADLIADSQVKLELRNFLLERDFDGATADVGSWSQAADLQFVSGYTATPIQFGIDASATGAYVFDSTGDDGSLPYDSLAGETAESYGRAGATLKFKYGATELTVGDHRPHLPVAWDDTTRVLDTIYEGAVIRSTAIENLDLTAGRFWQLVGRDSSNKEDLALYRGTSGKRSDGLDFVGGTYTFPKGFKGTYFYGTLNDIYTQQYLALEQTSGLSNGMKLKSEVRYFDNESDGKEYEGDLDVDALGAMVTLLAGNHMAALSVQTIDGDRPFPTLDGYVPQPALLHWTTSPFIMPDEQSWGVRYGYDFKGLGVPGLKVLARYTRGTDIDIAGGTDESHSERNIYLSYEVQEAALKGLKFDLRSISVDRSWADDYEEYRFITTYSVNF